MITTAGFRDVLEIARGNRPDLYNLRLVKETAFVPRAFASKCVSAWTPKGGCSSRLRLEDVDAVVESCRRERVEAIAVFFLHSYVARPMRSPVPTSEKAFTGNSRDGLPSDDP